VRGIEISGSLLSSAPKAMRRESSMTSIHAAQSFLELGLLVRSLREYPSRQAKPSQLRYLIRKVWRKRTSRIR
jgi:hypothetical protein